MRSVYNVVIEGGREFSGYIPDLPGCIAVGSSRDEVLRLLQQGAAIYVKELAESGEPISAPSTDVAAVAVDVPPA